MQPNTPIDPNLPSSVPEVTPPVEIPVSSAVKKSPKKLIIIIAAGLILLAGIATGLYLLFGNKGATPVSVINNAKDAIAGKKDVTDRPDGTLDLSNSVDGTTSIAEQSLTAKLNQQVNLNNGLSLMVTKVERNFTGFDSNYLTVKDGEEVVAVTVVAGNRGTNSIDVGNSSITLSAVSDPAITPEFVSSLAKVQNKFDTGNSGLDQGKQVSGLVLYIVAKGENIQSFNYTAKYKNYNDDSTITLKAIINL